MSTMRWADSDSDSDDEFVPPPPSSPRPPQGPDPEFSSHPSAPALEKHRDRDSQQRVLHQGGRGAYSRHPQHAGYSGGRGGRGSRAGDDRGGGRGRHKNQQNYQRQQQPSDWKEVAKASSRFSNANAPVDGSAWMAQRKAKMEQEEQQQKIEQEQRLRKQQEEKRERRKSQLGALKAAMEELKVSEPPAPMSPDASSRGTNGPAKIVKNESPKQILKREEAKTKLGSQQKSIEAAEAASEEKPRSWREHQKAPPASTSMAGSAKYSYTVGQSPSARPKPKAQLQPDGSVKFIRQSSIKSVEEQNGDLPEQSQIPQKGSSDLSKPKNDKDDEVRNNKGSKKNTNTTHTFDFDGKNTPSSRSSHGTRFDERSSASRGSRDSTARDGGGRGGGRGRSGRGRNDRHNNNQSISGAGRGHGDEGSVSSRGSSNRGGRGRGRGRRRGRSGGRSKDPHPSKDRKSSNDNVSENAGRGVREGRGAREGHGRGRGGRENGGRKSDILGGRNHSNSSSNNKNQGSTSPKPKPKYSYEIGAD